MELGVRSELGHIRVGGRAVRDFWRLYGSASLGFGGRAVVQPGNGMILAGFDRFRHNELNMAFSSRGLCSCSLTHARSKLLGLPAVIQSRIGKGTMLKGSE